MMLVVSVAVYTAIGAGASYSTKSFMSPVKCSDAPELSIRAASVKFSSPIWREGSLLYAVAKIHG